MKKLLVIGFAFLVSFFSAEISAQTIQSVTITSPILCYGDEASINIQVNQTIPPTTLMVTVGYTLFGQFVPYTSSYNTTVSYINVTNLPAQNYIIRLIDLVTET